MNTKAIAKSTVDALERGSYTDPSGAVVNIAEMLDRCKQGTHCYSPAEGDQVWEQVVNQAVHFEPVNFEVKNETTLEGCARLAATSEYQRIGVLNFASAKNPGGGFLGGAKAQEESLARSSALYYSLLECPDYYTFHRHQDTVLYSDHMIYSPDCPILRLDDGTWLEKPYTVDFITSPAPNAGAVLKNEPHNLDKIAPVLRERSAKVLALAAYHHCDALVLGAWGCGVFRNDPQLVAQTFWEWLSKAGLFGMRFRKVLFSVLDKSESQATYKAFAERF